MRFLNKGKIKSFTALNFAISCFNTTGIAGFSKETCRLFLLSGTKKTGLADV